MNRATCPGRGSRLRAGISCRGCAASRARRPRARSSGNGPAAQAAADGAQNRLPSDIITASRRAGRARSGRRTSRLPAPAGRARRSSRRPAAGSEPPALAARAAQPQAAARVAQPVERAAAGRTSPRAPVRARRRRGQVPLELPLAPVAHQGGQRNPHRADALALAAEGAGVRQVAGLVHADQRRRQHAAHRPGIDPAIGVAADGEIDRAVVQAGGAADAAQHVLERRAQHVGAPVVDQHDMVVVRPVEVARPPAAGRERRVDRHVLPGRRARQQPQQRAGILQRRHDLLDAGEHDVHPRQRLGQVAVALVGDDDAAAGLRDQEVGPGDADIGGEELLRGAGCAPRPGCRAGRRTPGRPAGRCGPPGSSAPSPRG